MLVVVLLGVATLMELESSSFAVIAFLRLLLFVAAHSFQMNTVVVVVAVAAAAMAMVGIRRCFQSYLSDLAVYPSVGCDFVQR